MENWLSEMERSSAVSFASVVELLQLRGLSPDCGGLDDGGSSAVAYFGVFEWKASRVCSRRGMLAWTGPGHRRDHPSHPSGRDNCRCFVIQFISSPETQ